ncbi:hypothetical protein CEXT_216041 [Caerostris extrusa]|uniref:Uncharacterized protein n=1 Tax=Caerostris extrusa TaxID=172846 RepID=A0AAV4SUK6_CAEEX|nr:hypothetical protein CEXT_216041 [Caerostris extrusa]
MRASKQATPREALKEKTVIMEARGRGGGKAVQGDTTVLESPFGGGSFLKRHGTKMGVVYQVLPACLSNDISSTCHWKKKSVEKRSHCGAGTAEAPSRSLAASGLPTELEQNFCFPPRAP